MPNQEELLRPGNQNESIRPADETITKLCESINQQQQITSIAGLNIPEFGGGPHEDVTEFLQKFKATTFSLNDELKCIALRKALVNSARIWAKDNLKELILVGDWKEAKKAIEERFQSADYHERYHKKLLAMKYEPKEITLRSYVEGYVACFRKAHKTATDKNIIESLVQNLPTSIKHTLNMLSETWRQMDELKMLYPLIKRVEQTILPYAPAEQDPGEKLNVTTMAKLLKQMQEEFKKDCLDKIKLEAKTTQEEAVAAIGRIYNQHGSNGNVDQRDVNKAPYPRFPARQHGFKDAQNMRYNRYQAYAQENNRQRRPPQPMPNRPLSFEHNEKYKKEFGRQNVQETYYQRFGKPPRPCLHCQESHFNRHCPYKHLN